MSEPDRPPDPAEEPTLAAELAKIPYEPLLPVEKKLIAWSLILGVVLLGILLWASATLFPIPPATRRAASPEAGSDGHLLGSRRAANPGHIHRDPAVRGPRADPGDGGHRRRGGDGRP
jgi:hypothetical protein